MKGALIVAVIVAIAATPGIMESYLAWQQYPETRQWIVGAYLVLLALAILAVQTGIDGKI